MSKVIIKMINLLLVFIQVNEICVPAYQKMTYLWTVRKQLLPTA